MEDVEQAHWYCLRTQPKRELVAGQLLRTHLDIEVFNPRIRFKRTRETKLIWVNEAMFPGYIFAKFHYQTHHRHVASTRGIAKIVTFGRHIPEVPPAIIEELRSLMNDTETVEIKPYFEEGDAVKVVSSSLQGIHAIVSKILPARKRIAILIEILGMVREVDVDMDIVLPDLPHPLASSHHPPTG